VFHLAGDEFRLEYASVRYHGLSTRPATVLNGSVSFPNLPDVAEVSSADSSPNLLVLHEYTLSIELANTGNYRLFPKCHPTMPTVKLKDWTKEKLDDIKEEEEHSSYDSVIKSLIKEHESSNK
jgi:hypothetical protein